MYLLIATRNHWRVKEQDYFSHEAAQTEAQRLIDHNEADYVVVYEKVDSFSKTDGGSFHIKKGAK